MLSAASLRSLPLIFRFLLFVRGLAVSVSLVSALWPLRCLVFSVLPVVWSGAWHAPGGILVMWPLFLLLLILFLVFPFHVCCTFCRDPRPLGILSRLGVHLPAVFAVHLRSVCCYVLRPGDDLLFRHVLSASAVTQGTFSAALQRSSRELAATPRGTGAVAGGPSVPWWSLTVAFPRASQSLSPPVPLVGQDGWGGPE